MNNGPTYCADCDNCIRENKSDPPYRWLCAKHKRLEGFGYVVKGVWANMPPYLYAKDCNGGACPLFKPAAPGQMKLNVETPK